MIRQVGDFLQADFFDNVGGVNLSDSPFKVQDSQATGGKNFEYALTGGIRKKNGATLVNSSADTALRSVGLGLYNTADSTKTVIRCADRKIQAVSLTAPSFTNLTSDVASPSSDILASSNTQPVVKSQFNTSLANVLWLAGGGMGLPYGVYSTTKVTQNGSVAPTGSITLTRNGAAGGAFASTGYYRYGVALRKASTQALSNVLLFKEVQVTATTDSVTIDVSGLTGLDATKYDQIYIYRSAVSATAQGNTAFTTGDQLTAISTATSSATDLGSYVLTAQNVPGAGNTIDNSTLPSGTYNVLTTWKRRLVTALNSTLYISDTNKPESWPTANPIVIPSGGAITGLAVISFTTPTSTSIDEILVVFKERELWVVTGASSSDFALKYIDAVGCVNQPLITYANGYLAWIDYRGIYLWDGSGKPIYCSRPIENIFRKDGTIDKSKLNLGWGEFYRNNSVIVWVLSTNTEGEQLFSIKLDLRLTIPAVQSNLGGRVIDAVLIPDVLAYPLYSAGAMVPTSTDEILLSGDKSGKIYKLFDTVSDAGSGVDFQYETKYFDLEEPGTSKRYQKVIAWVEDTSDGKLTLDYWTSYTAGTNELTTRQETISYQVAEAYWDLATWDAAYWDLYQPTFKPVVFNLAPSSNNSTEGDCIKLRFKQSDSNAPITIAGFSIIYSRGGSRK